MIEHVINTGDRGRLRIQDRTDEPGLNVELWIQSLSPVAIPALPWTYSINGNMTGWKSFNFLPTTVWQRLAVVYAGRSQNFTLHLGATGTSQLAGPTDHPINLEGYVPGEGTDSPGMIMVKVGAQYKKATPYVKVNGVWQVAQPFVRTDRGWTEV